MSTGLLLLCNFQLINLLHVSTTQGDFDFAKVYSDDFEETELPKGSEPCSRFQWGKHLMEKFSEDGEYEYLR